MTSEDNQSVSQRSPERQNSTGDDPWCLTCGVNLALDARTYTVVTRHSNSELCDIFSRVLGAEFNEDYASVNVCNSCERQLRRIGRYNSIVLARHEGEKLREQLEKNLAKHGQEVVESGHAEDVSLPTSDTEALTKGDTCVFSNTGEKRQGHERHSGIRRRGQHTSRSVSSVHFEDKEEAGRRHALVRKYSAPEGLRKRESLSPFSEAERRRQARRRKWSSASSTSEEGTITSIAIPQDWKHSLGNRVSPLTFQQQRYAEMSNETSIPADQHEVSDETAVTSSNIIEEPADGPSEVPPSDIHTEEQEMNSCDGQDDQRDKSVDHEEGLTRMDTLQADDELFKTLEEEDPIEESPHDIESWNEADLDPSDFNADNRSSLSDVEDRITTKTKFKGAYYNIGSTEDLLQEFANECDRDRAMWSKLTYTESIDVGDGGAEPVRPPRRKSVKSLQQKRDGQIQDGTKGSDVDGGKPEQIREECESPDGTETSKHVTGNDVMANGVLPGEEGEEGKTVATFDMESPEGTDSQTAQDALTSKAKTEKSPLIGKDGGSSNLQLRNGTRMKKQLQGFLCCTIL